MALTDTAIRKIKPTEKSFKITDSSGPNLLLKPNGSKLWYMKYRVDGKEKKLAFVTIWRRGLASSDSRLRTGYSHSPLKAYTLK
ncbi:TPA: Arm DNA-binding domain-containing protein [Salmonella enterica subsp. enterica serovar Goldcoast]|uniref:Arm DNA-binding domain-containing protein n=1 Tax=Salmonella TaxID=590 RepID=UPI000F71B4AA|nr:MULTISPECIES: Arm DNA-binding domain-containing protein [Salmonella]VEA86327.1 Prophage CP4-57 integrase [Salmonella enterica subsp. enterica serovar Goldcoast]